MMTDKNIVGCDRQAFPHVIRAWIQRTTIDYIHVGCLREKCSPLFFSKGTILARSIEALSDGLDESFHYSVLITNVRYVPFLFNVTREIFRENTLNLGNVPAQHYFV